MGLRGVKLGLAIGCWVSMTLAAPRDPAAAETLFKAGRLAFEQGDYQVACAKFEESQRLDPGAGTLINLAACQEKLGNLALAWQTWQQALRWLPSEDERRPGVQARADAMEQRVPRLAVKVVGELPADAELLRDGLVLRRPSWGVSLPVDPGRHELQLRAPGHEPARLAVALAEGEQKTVELGLGPKLPQPAPASEARTTPRADPTPKTGDAKPAASSGSSLAWVLLGAGGASLLASGVTGYLALGKKQTMDDECVEQSGRRLCSARGLDAADSGRTLATVSTILGGVGIVGVGVGGYLLLQGQGSEPRAGVGVSLRPGQGSLNFQGAF